MRETRGVPVQQNPEVLVHKIRGLSPEEIEEVDHFVDRLRLRDRDLADTWAASSMSAPTFEAVWSNPEDDVYDAL